MIGHLFYNKNVFSTQGSLYIALNLYGNGGHHESFPTNTVDYVFNDSPSVLNASEYVFNSALNADDANPYLFNGD